MSPLMIPHSSAYEKVAVKPRAVHRRIGSSPSRSQPCGAIHPRGTAWSIEQPVRLPHGSSGTGAARSSSPRLRGQHPHPLPHCLHLLLCRRITIAPELHEPAVGLQRCLLVASPVVDLASHAVGGRPKELAIEHRV